jgi:hypothetical protein
MDVASIVPHCIFSALNLVDQKYQEIGIPSYATSQAKTRSGAISIELGGLWGLSGPRLELAGDAAGITCGSDASPTEDRPAMHHARGG